MPRALWSGNREAYLDCFDAWTREQAWDLEELPPVLLGLLKADPSDFPRHLVLYSREIAVLKNHGPL